MQNIALIGFMATGKSTIGPALGRALGWRVVDTDQEIERLSGMSITDIWRMHGEPVFRQREEQIVADLSQQKGIVIVTGGGVVLSEQNVASLMTNSFVVGLRASVEIIVERVRRDTKRPLLAGTDPSERVRTLLSSREGKYDFAHLTIDTSRTTVGRVVRMILEHPLCPCPGKRTRE